MNNNRGGGYFSHSPSQLDDCNVAINMPITDDSALAPNQRDDNNYNSDNETSSNSRMSPVEVDVCFPTPNKKEEGGIDYEALEDFITLEKEEAAENRHEGGGGRPHRRRLSTMGASDGRRFSLYGDRMMVKYSSWQ